MNDVAGLVGFVSTAPVGERNREPASPIFPSLNARNGNVARGAHRRYLIDTRQRAEPERALESRRCTPLCHPTRCRRPSSVRRAQRPCFGSIPSLSRPQAWQHKRLLLVGVPPSFSPPLNLRIPAVRKPRNGRSPSFIATAYLARWATISRLASRATRPAPMIVADAAPVQFPYPMSHKPGTAVDC